MRYNKSGGGQRRGGGMRRHHSGPRNHQSNPGTGDDVLNQRPRRNWRALQENYLNKARSAMSEGDRVMAEYYLQHADHYFRENAAFLTERNERYAQQRPQTPQQDGVSPPPPTEESAQAEMNEAPMEDINPYMSRSSSALPAFITRESKPGAAPAAPPAQNWEDRDNS